MASKTWTTSNIPSQEGQVAIITGANSGMGYEASLALAKQGATVIMACRNKAKAKAALAQIKQAVPKAKVEVMDLNLASQQSIRAFATAFTAKYDRLDLLLNNAGIMMVPYGTTEDGFELQLGTNHLGHFALTGLLMDVIKASEGARVVTMSSGAHTMARVNFDNLQYEGGRGYSPSFAYGRSKLANLLFTYALQRKFEADNIPAISLAAHPGGAQTNLGSHMEKTLMGKLMKPIMSRTMQSAAMGALPILRAATDPNAKGGQYYGPDGFTGNTGYPILVKSSKRSHDQVSQDRLWTLSEQLTGVSYL